MKVAILSESSADEAALRVLVDGILEEQTEPIVLPPLRTRGWPSVRQGLRNVILHLHYHTDANSLALVVDSNNSPVHLRAHEHELERDPRCRMCDLHNIATQTLARLRPVAGRTPLKVAVGIAVPAVEAWYRCGVDSRVTESAWIHALDSRTFGYTKQSLKLDVYGTDHPSLSHETTRAIEETNRLVGEKLIARLEQSFPAGFGSLLRDVQNW